MSHPRILVIRGGAIGDFICTLPAVAALRKQWPTARLEILGYPHIIELAHGRGYADAVRSIEARPLAGFFIPNSVLDPDLVGYFGSFNVVVSYLFDPDEVFANNVRRCGARQYIAASPRVGNLPAAQHYCQPLESLAIYVTDPRPRIYPNAADQAAASRYLADWTAEPLAVVHPGSGGERKNWPVEKFAAISRWLMDERRLRLVVVAGEADEAPCRALAQELTGRDFRWARGLKLVELAAVLQRSAVYVGNDSGITHLAAAVGAPTVALFGAESSLLWQPVGAKVRVVKMGADDESEAQRNAAEIAIA